MNNTADGLEFATVESGVADHGSLTGLSDDDHTQYHNDSRANTWLGTKSTTNLSEGTNLYFTTARAKAAVVSDSITDGVTDVAPSQNAVFDALAGKQNSLGYTAANDTNVVHLSGNETITGLKEFDITATASDNGNNKGLKVSISEQNDSLVNNGATVGTSSTVTTQSNANRENWFILGDVKTVENDGSGNVDTIAGQLNQANQIGSGSVNAIVGAINNSYIDNASAVSFKKPRLLVPRTAPTLNAIAFVFEPLPDSKTSPTTPTAVVTFPFIFSAVFAEPTKLVALAEMLS